MTAQTPPQILRRAAPPAESLVCAVRLRRAHPAAQLGRVSDMFASAAYDPRHHGATRGERQNVLTYLDNYRLTLEMKCQGLSPLQLSSRIVPPSDLSLLGLVRHMAGVEHNWFRRVLGERLDLPRMWPEDPTGGFADVEATTEAVADAWDAYRAEVEHARALTRDLPQEAMGIEVPLDDSRNISVRAILVHMVEEYARHVGHADLLRERLDGRTGQ